MKLAISNIAWPREGDVGVAALMAAQGFGGVEIAPTRVWEQPLEAAEKEVREHRRFWNDRGIEVVALQALLFGRPDLVLFESEKARDDMLDHLRGMIRLASWLGAGVLVLGAPKNRKRSGMTASEAERVAVDFFRAAAGSAFESGVVLLIEPNPRQYGCDFITSSREGLDLVRKVASPGFGLHLDAAAMTLAGEDPEKAIAACSGEISHFHASEPSLGPLGAGSVDHEAIAKALRRIEYPSWVSVEMRDPGTSLVEVLGYAAGAYGYLPKT